MYIYICKASGYILVSIWKCVPHASLTRKAVQWILTPNSCCKHTHEHIQAPTKGKYEKKYGRTSLFYNFSIFRCFFFAKIYFLCFIFRVAWRHPFWRCVSVKRYGFTRCNELSYINTTKQWIARCIHNFKWYKYFMELHLEMKEQHVVC